MAISIKTLDEGSTRACPSCQGDTNLLEVSSDGDVQRVMKCNQFSWSQEVQ